MSSDLWGGEGGVEFVEVRLGGTRRVTPKEVSK